MSQFPERTYEGGVLAGRQEMLQEILESASRTPPAPATTAAVENARRFIALPTVDGDSKRIIRALLDAAPPAPEAAPPSFEQQARDLLARTGVEDAQRFTSGDVIELANLIADHNRLKRAALASSAPTPAPPIEDAVCEHGAAMDVHCCNCHSGFIFDKDHECPDPTVAPPTPEPTPAEPEILIGGPPSPLLALYATDEWKRAEPAAWLDQLKDDVKHECADRLIALAARHYVAALARVPVSSAAKPADSTEGE